MIRKGDRIHLNDGSTGTVVGIGLGDFIGDPRPVTVQVVHEGSVEHRTMLESEMRRRG